MFDRVKKATVALVTMRDQNVSQDDRKPPFVIVGSGFCIHPRGLIITCQHVLSGFMSKPVSQQLAEVSEEERGKEIQRGPEVESMVPHALFFDFDVYSSKERLVAFAARADIVVAKTDFDLGMIRVHPHNGFPNGFPSVEIEDYEQVREGMEIATCGFPLGNFLGEQIGTVTSSFTRGIVSSIIPAPGVAKEYVIGFQLNLTATHGNSGGPVFSLGSGKVFGVLERGVRGTDGNILQGITKAEPVYPVFEHNLLERMLKAPTGQVPSLS